MRQVSGGRLAARRAAELLIRRHGAALLATARRYTTSLDDAEDAYQRGLEILLRRGPMLGDEDLLRWTRTVIRHEAFAIWRSRERAGVTGDEPPLEQAAVASPSPDEELEGLERLRLSAEAIARLKPQEVRCLLLRADGHSYQEICRITGWTYTKVNRCLTEGRRSFAQRVAGIESGAECTRLAPLLSALADGEATADDMAALRPHLRSCLSCRAALRAYRELPHRAAEAVPLVGAAAEEEWPATLSRCGEAVIAWAQERVALIGAKAQAAAEAASASKVAAVAASTAALAGGTVAVRSLESERAVGAPQPAAERPTRVLERAAPANLLPSLPKEPQAVPPAPPPPAAEVPVVEPPAPPRPPAPAPLDEPPPAAPVATRPHIPTPAPASVPERAAIPVTSPRREHAAAEVNQEERTIDPMTTPMERPVEPEAPDTAAEE